jgi:hypothetical protein
VTLTLLGRIRDGRIVVDEPTDLPDGTEVHLSVVDDVDDLDDQDRARLHAALDQAQEQIARGEGVPGEQVLASLRASRPR